jgi:hypothetical protein
VKLVNPIVKSGLSALWMVKPVSVIELSFQDNFTLLPSRVAVRSVGGLGATAKTVECIMSFSSWARMWQW